jgi:flagellar L-ring protein precursor FlgH
MNRPFSSRFKLARPLALLALGALLLPAPARAQSLWRDDVSKPMYADKRASLVGDIITVIVQETTTASKNNRTATSRESSVDASIASFFYSPAGSSFLTKGGQMPAVRFNGKNDYNGGGTINNSEKIISYVAVRVIDVLPNRNMVIEGRRETAFGGEQQTIVLRGVVRPDDVTANNTILSYNIADSSIHIVSKGQLTDSQRKSWFVRLWDKLSPF